MPNLLPYLKGVSQAILLLAGMVVLYGLAAVLLSLISVNSDFEQPENGVTIYLVSNGAHVDICTPVTNSIFDWSQFLDLNDFEPGDHQYISVGWGDKGFYMETPTWAELRLSVAFKALFLPSGSAMHVTALDGVPQRGKEIIPITLTEEQYRTLILELTERFQKVNGLPEVVVAPYDYYPNSNDRFYEAYGSYSYNETCNVWTNNVLKRAGVKSAVWAPFSWSVLVHHKR